MKTSVATVVALYVERQPCYRCVPCGGVVARSDVGRHMAYHVDERNLYGDTAPPVYRVDEAI